MIRDVALGAFAGAGATLPMSGVMWIAQQAGVMGKHPPEQITEALLRTAGIRASKEEKERFALLNHVGFGAVCGALFSLVRRREGNLADGLAAGIAFALAVWLASYEGWVPALGIMPPVDKDRPGRPAAMAAAHAVFGASMTLLLRGLRR